LTLTISVADIVEHSGEVLLAKHESWQRVRLDDIATILNGYAFQSKNFRKDTGTPLLRIRDVGTSTTECKYLGEYEQKYLVDAGDFVVGMDGDFKCGRWNGPTALLNQRVCKIEINSDGYIPRLLELVLPGYLEAIGAHTSSQTVKHLSSSSLADLPLPLPPIAEQERIVEQVDQLLNGVTSSRNHLSRVPAILKRFRQAVLAAACSGRLTEDWRDSCNQIESVSSLLGRVRHIRERLSPTSKRKSHPFQPRTDLRDIPSTWCWIPFGDLVASLRSGSTEVPQNEESVYPILRSSSVRPRAVDLEDVRFLTERQSQNPANFIAEGDMLFTRLSGSIEFVANCAVVPALNGERIQYPDRLFCAKLLEPQCIQFCQLCFASPILRDFITIESKSSAGHQRISMNAITDMPIPLPPLAEQQEVVRRVDRLFGLAHQIERHIIAATKRADSLTQSILAKAFRGELVPTEAELARREGRDYEPASVLLNRIKRQRQGILVGRL
jgi:type I restriction enzyme, S subunit